MAVPDNPLTKILVEVPAHADIDSISPGRRGIVADIFDPSGRLVPKPCDLAEAAHPQNIWFKLNVSENHFKEGITEMGKLCHMGFSNFGILLSGIKDAGEISRVRFLAAECGFSFGVEIPFGVLIEYPGMALSCDAISKAGASFAVMDIDSLSKRIMCAEKIHCEIPEPVLKVVLDSIGQLKQKKIHVAVRGHMLENMAVLNDLLNHGIDSLVTQSENLEKIKLKAIYAEKSHEIDFLKSKMRMHIRRH